MIRAAAARHATCGAAALATAGPQPYPCWQTTKTAPATSNIQTPSLQFIEGDVMIPSFERMSMSNRLLFRCFQLSLPIGFASFAVLGSYLLEKDSRCVRCEQGTSECGCRRKESVSFLSSSDKEADDSSSFRNKNLPIYTSQQISQHDGEKSSTVWMSYGGFVYDVTQFTPLHPGGTARIRRAAGAAMEPYWYLHTQHFRTDEPLRILSQLVVGRLKEEDQERIEAQVEDL